MEDVIVAGRGCSLFHKTPGWNQKRSIMWVLMQFGEACLASSTDTHTHTHPAPTQPASSVTSVGNNRQATKGFRGRDFCVWQIWTDCPFRLSAMGTSMPLVPYMNERKKGCERLSGDKTRLNKEQSGLLHLIHFQAGKKNKRNLLARVLTIKTSLESAECSRII